jgi:hypothetical protein
MILDMSGQSFIIWLIMAAMATVKGSIKYFRRRSIERSLSTRRPGVYQGLLSEDENLIGGEWILKMYSPAYGEMTDSGRWEATRSKNNLSDELTKYLVRKKELALVSGLVGQKTPEQPAGQEFRLFRSFLHERCAFERSGLTLDDLKPSIFVEKIHGSLYSKPFLGKRYKSSLHH